MKNLILCILFLSITLYAQEARKVGTSVASTFITQGYVLSSISSSGFSKLLNHQVSNLGNINPASLSQFEQSSFAFSYQFETDINPGWIGNVAHSRGQLLKPQSVAMVLPGNRFAFGFSFNQRYNSILDFGKIEITTVENPLGTGKYLTASKNEFIDSYSALVAYSLFNGENDINLGIRLDLNIIDYEDKIYKLVASATGHTFSGAIGINYQMDEDIKIGLYYDWAPKFNEKVKLNDELIVLIDIDSSQTGNNESIIAAIAQEEYHLKSKLPDNLNFAIAINLNETYSTVLDLTYIFWKQYSENSNNNLDISSSILANINEELTLSFGFLLTDRDYDGDLDSAFNANSNLDGFFLLAGANVKLNILDLDFSVASSHLGSGKWREQFIGKVGIGFNF